MVVSVSPHIPKPHTPFAWAAQVDTPELNRRLGVLREAVKGKPITLKYRDAETSMLEGVFTRGDRRLGALIEDAFQRGCRFDAWSEHLRYATWLDVFATHGVDPERYLLERDHALDQIALAVEGEVAGALLFAIGFRRDDGRDLAVFQGGDEPVGVVALVGEQRFGLEPFEQRLGLCDVGGLPRRQRQCDGIAERIDDGMDLRRQAAA